jgi:hypothetical protein
VKIALMTYEKGLWLQVGDEWYCILNICGRPINERVAAQTYTAKNRAPLYKDLSSIVLGEDDDSRSS